MTLRELCDVVGIDSDPLGCCFVIAAVLRSAVQGEPSTFEGECASILKAHEHYDTWTGAGVRAWLDGLGEAATLDLPDGFILSIMSADGEEEDSSADPGPGE